MDYGAKGNCLFLSVAGNLRSVHPSSSHTHSSLRSQVSLWYKVNGLQHQKFLGAKPSDVIFDNPNQPPQNIFETWSWADWGAHIASDGIWGGSSEIMALNAVLPDGFTVNIYDTRSGVIHGSEHNMATDTIFLVRFSA